MQTAPTEEEFKAWRDDPVTVYVRKAYERMADEQKEAWINWSWEGDNTDPIALARLKTRADAYRSMSESDLSDFASLFEPEAE